MKIAVSGKGGSGKTTLSATLARIFARRGLSVLAIDGDPNPNLGVALGVEAPGLATLQPLPRTIIEQRTDASGGTQVALASRWRPSPPSTACTPPTTSPSCSRAGLTTRALVDCAAHMPPCVACWAN